MIQIKFTNNGVKKTHKIKTSWNELILSEAIEVHKCIDTFMPAVVKEIYTMYANGQDKKFPEQLKALLAAVTDEDNCINLPTFYGELIQVISDINPQDLAMISPASRCMIYESYLVGLVSSIMFFPQFEPKNIASFEIDGAEYFLPVTDKALGAEVPMSDRTAIEFSEVADLDLNSKELAGGKYERAKEIISILCRPKVNGVLEKYDQKKCLERADSFLKLPMEIVFEVFFCFIKRSIIFEKHGQIYLSEVKDLKPLSTITGGTPQSYRLRKLVSLVTSSKSKQVTYTIG